MQVVQHGESCHFDFWHIRAEEQTLRSILAPSAGCHVSILCTDCEPRTARVDVDGCTSLTTRSTQSGAPLRVMVEVTSEADATLVVVRSALQLTNGCALPLDCLLYSPQLAREEVLTLPADTPTPVPLSLSTDGVMVRIRPAEQPQYRWSAPLMVAPRKARDSTFCTRAPRGHRVHSG